jgi:hypothetical protein
VAATQQLKKHLFLTKFASEVVVVHRRDEFRAERILQNRLFENPKVKVMWDTTLEEVIGDENPLGVTAARLRNVKTQAVEDLSCDGIFIAIGHKPATELFEGKLKMKNGGYLLTEPDSAPQPPLRASMRQVMSPTTSTGRPSRLPAWAAWRPLRQRNFWLKQAMKPRRQPSRTRPRIPCHFQSGTTTLTGTSCASSTR